MNILFETEVTKDIAEKYILLELDTFLKTQSGDKVRSFCVITNESIPLQEIAVMKKNQELHENLIKNYRLRNWDFCEEAISHLVGKWKAEADSFYQILGKRIQEYKDQPVPVDWDYSIPLPS
jgi:hypothetical protein|tara:strand:- start:7 stop:372 length:366 start_codon:yes stop_codon:yes gene_type:complete